MSWLFTYRLVNLDFIINISFVRGILRGMFLFFVGCIWGEVGILRVSNTGSVYLRSEIFKMNIKDSEDVKEEAVIKINTRGALRDFK